MLDKNLLGKSIKEARKKQKMSQIALSLATNLSRSYISDVENGRYAPSLETLMRIAIVLKVSLDELAYGKVA
jgi:transcriptional regulator with XRE-family HTH domain